MQTLKNFYSFVATDIREARRLVSLKLSALSTAVGAMILTNQQFLLQMLDRIADHAMRNAIVGGALFLVIFVPALKSEFSPVPTPPAPPGSPDAGQ